ncbi:MAG: BamA/TamA family outer membrane protein [Candidatus Margulisbacteria bacterium]|nr:BamA/TamA family outer membrane protein [Candidatus Margulisiibacteriota bacterium]
MLRLFFILLIGLFSFLQATTLNSIIISGNKAISSQDILAVITNKPGEELVTENILADIHNIYNMGYFKDSVSAETVFVSGNKADLIFTIEENPVVNQIYFVGLTAFKQEELMASMNMKKGKILNYSELRQDIQNITNFYHERGYVLMNVKEISEPQDDNILTIVLKEGIIEDIFFKGMAFTKEYVLTREMETQIGTAFNINTIQEDMRNIYNTGYVDNINIDPPMAGVNPDKVVVVINVQEKRSGSLQFGGGIGSATGFFGFIQLSFINFLGEGYNMSTKGQWGEKQLTYEFKYFNPWFFKDHTSMTFRLWNTDGLIDEGQGLKAFNTGGEVILGKPLTKQISGFVSARVNNVIPQETSINSYEVRSIGGGLSYDTRDYIFNPSSGDYALVNANASLKVLGASIEFIKYRIKYNKYFPLGNDFALGFKGTIDDSFGTIFDTERYFAGGATTVRGYRDGSPFAIGGRRFLGTVELRYNINQQMQLYFFYDLGKVTKGLADCNFTGDPTWRTGKGIGFKIITPIGPLRFDYAWGDGKPYSDNLDSSSGVIHFNIENTF